MAESLTLAAPIVRPQTTGFSITRISLGFADRYIEVVLTGDDGVESRLYTWTGDTAAQMLTAFVKADFRTKSLPKRLFERLVSDGLLAGTIVGTPE